MVGNFGAVVLGHFHPVDHVLQLLKHFCVEELCFFSLESIYFSVPGSRLAVLPEACQTCSQVRKEGVHDRSG